MNIVFSDVYGIQKYGSKEVAEYLESNDLYLVITSFISSIKDLKKATSYQRKCFTKHSNRNKEYFKEDITKRISKRLVGCNLYVSGIITRNSQVYGREINNFLDTFKEIEPEIKEIWKFNMSNLPDNEYFVTDSRDPCFVGDYEGNQIPFIRIIHKTDKL